MIVFIYISYVCNLSGKNRTFWKLQLSLISIINRKQIVFIFYCLNHFNFKRILILGFFWFFYISLLYYIIYIYYITKLKKGYVSSVCFHVLYVNVLYKLEVLGTLLTSDTRPRYIAYSFSHANYIKKMEVLF
jgi:hypothetical protein